MDFNTSTWYLVKYIGNMKNQKLQYKVVTIGSTRLPTGKARPKVIFWRQIFWIPDLKWGWSWRWSPIISFEDRNRRATLHIKARIIGRTQVSFDGSDGHTWSLVCLYMFNFSFYRNIKFRAINVHIIIR